MGEVTALNPVLRVAQALQEPKAVTVRRDAAWKLYESLEVPRLEKTDLRRVAWEVGEFEPSDAPVPEAALGYVRELAHSYALVVDGRIREIHLSEEAKEKGVVVTSILEACDAHPEIWNRHFGTIVPAEEAKWTALNMALFAGGLFVLVPRGAELEQPVEVVYVWTGRTFSACSRSLVVTEPLSRLRYAETTFASDGGRFVNSHVLEVFAGQASRVEIATADEWAKGGIHFVTRRAKAGNDAEIDWVVADTSDGQAVETIESALVGQGSRSFARVMGLGHGRAHVEITASMRHVGRHTESEISMNGALRDRANVIFRSRTQIEKGAVGAGSEQHDRMIMVDGTARADAIPMLLIDENDVERCGHAASVGKIDPLQVYYLMSRGIPQSVAVQMIIWGYLRDSVEALPSDAMRDLVVSRVERELAR
ncbi:SufD family Fe-S cluster assembly protein [Alicyclobacillus mali]|uniref:SufD family Fe-S cluster assembly protein n=1 Tax=Alicyclobacillus mali (ex Roth et al. 2021) TaxID=1123961 RepID=A0ABS0F127_9BACL|nr:SufD family Fe-S cluster assembly protein [Alicyclobacillus mali (ex Roth et al. 2021)]MBF8376995.1 SufD family Fe-S cluster assembly protein [Alicyclobacillus mali (ex Roth et al. 2021)]